MRREGYELSVSRPKVLLRDDPATGEALEPIEEVVIDLDEEHSGIVVQKMSERKAELVEMRPSGGGRQRLVFYAPTRGLIGYQGELLTDTRGTAIMNRLFHAYAPFKGTIQGRRNGVLISNEAGEAVAYALWNLEDRGPMMVEPGWKVYRGMIVGEHTRDNDLVVNVLKGKKLTNIRTTSKDEAVRLTPPIRMTLEKALAYIQDDELVEVTPKSIRLRKKLLDEQRAQARRAAQGRPNRSDARPGVGANSRRNSLSQFGTLSNQCRVRRSRGGLGAAGNTVARLVRTLSHRFCRSSVAALQQMRRMPINSGLFRLSRTGFDDPMCVGFTPLADCINRSLNIGLEERRRACFYYRMSTTLIEVRRAKPSDAKAIAATHDEAWRGAYQGVIPGPELDKLINRRGTAVVGQRDPQGQPHRGAGVRRVRGGLRQLRPQPRTQPLLRWRSLRTLSAAGIPGAGLRTQAVHRGAA